MSYIYISISDIISIWNLYRIEAYFLHITTYVLYTIIYYVHPEYTAEV